MKTSPIIHLCVLLTLIAASIESAAQRVHLDSLSVFSPDQFRDTAYQVLSRHYSFGKYRISINNVRGHGAAWQCHSFVSITLARDTMYSKCFPDINALGGWAGVFSPAKPRLTDYFFISKFGDYEGELIILDKAGKVRNISGSRFYLSEDNVIIFADQDSDIGGLTIYDLSRDSLLYDSEISPELHVPGEKFLKEIRYDEVAYYLVYVEDKYVDLDGEEKKIRETSILCMNKETQKIRTVNLDDAILQKKHLLKLRNRPVDKKGINCNCGRPDSVD